MTAAAKRTMPVGLGIRVLAQLWLAHMRLRIARLLALLWQIKSSERILTAGRFGDLAGPAAWRTGAGILIGGLRRSWRGSDTRRVDGCVRSTLPG